MVANTPCITSDTKRDGAAWDVVVIFKARLTNIHFFLLVFLNYHSYWTMTITEHLAANEAEISSRSRWRSGKSWKKSECWTWDICQWAKYMLWSWLSRSLITNRLMMWPLCISEHKAQIVLRRKFGGHSGGSLKAARNGNYLFFTVTLWKTLFENIWLLFSTLSYFYIKKKIHNTTVGTKQYSKLL